MEREFPIWVIVLLPWIGALGCLLAARPGVRVLGSRRAVMLGHYIGLGAAALALLFAVQGVQHLMTSDDPRALGHTPLREWIGPIEIGRLYIESTLIADRLSTCAAVLTLGLAVLLRMFVPGPAGQRALFGAPIEQTDDDAARSGLMRLALLGGLEGAALWVALAGDLGLALVGWSLLGLGAAVMVARDATDEPRASAALRMLVLAVLGDLFWIVAGVALVISGIGLAHNGMWAPLAGDALYSDAFAGLSFADVIALALVIAAVLRMSSAAWLGTSLGEVLLDAVLLPMPAIYVLLRYLRALSYAPTVLAGLLVIGMLVALVAAAIALLRPRAGMPWRERSGAEIGLGGTQLAWVGLVMMALGVGAWRTAALALLAHALARLGLRVSLLIAGGERLPKWTSRLVRVLCFGAAGLVPSLGFVVLAQTMVDVLTRRSVLAPWVSWPAAAIVLLVAFMFTAAIARLWYEELGRKRDDGHEDEDGLDVAPVFVVVAALAGIGVLTFAAAFGLIRGPLAWLDKILPLAGGHEVAPTGWQDRFRDGGSVARPWIAGGAALVALVTGFAWTWARERFRRAHGGELATMTRSFEQSLGVVARVLGVFGLLAAGLTRLAAHAIGRGLFEELPVIVRNLWRDALAGLEPRRRALALAGGRLALLGVLAGFGLLLGWLYAKPQISSGLPAGDYGFGGLRPRLIRAGGEDSEPASKQAAPAPASAPVLAPPPARSDGAEPPLMPPEVPQ